MSAFIVSFLGSLVGTGVPMFFLGVLIKRQASLNANKAPALRPCSCTHGFGIHGKDGCGHVDRQVVKEGGNPIILKDRFGNQHLGANNATQRVIEMPCGCKQFDGEIPPDMIGREWMGIA